MMKKKYIFVLTFLCMFVGQMGYAIDGYKDDSDDTEMKEDLKEVVLINDYKEEDHESYFYYFISEITEPDYWADQGAGVYNPCAAETFDQCACDPSSCEGETPPEEQDPPCTIICPSGYILDIEYCECVKDPCDRDQQNTVKTQITDPYLAGRLSQVRTSLEPPNTSIEKGFAIYKDESGNNIAPTLKTGSSDSPSISIGFITSDPGYTPSAVLHSHPSGGYASPSPGDIYNLAGLYTSVNTVTTSYIVAADGTTYAMVVTDPDALDAFLWYYPASNNKLNEDYKPDSPMQKLYKEAYDSFTNSGLSDADAEERANAVVMAKAGITLLKAPTDSTDFKQIHATKVQDENGNGTFTKSDCP